MQLGRIVVWATRTARAARLATFTRIGCVQTDTGLARVHGNRRIRVDRRGRLACGLGSSALSGDLAGLSFARPLATAAPTKAPARTLTRAATLA